jgi:hypothetical protein
VAEKLLIFQASSTCFYGSQGGGPLVKAIRSAVFVLVLSCLSGIAAKADTLTYDLTGPAGFQAVFTLPQDPTFTATSFGYIVPVTGLTIYSIPITSIDFFNTANGGGIGADGAQLAGKQLYTFTSGSLVLSTGTFTLDEYNALFTLTITDGKTTPTPEPSTVWLLASGLAGLAFVRRIGSRSATRVVGDQRPS